MNTNRQIIDIDKTKRILSVLVALVVWSFSMKFSVSGFGNGVNQDEIWIGWALAGVITVVELVWNSMKEKTNLTIWVTGVFCYLYGISTNIIGILYWQGNTIDLALKTPMLWIFPVILGIFLEILPEPMFMLGITGDHNQGDFLGNLFGNKMIPNPNHIKPTSTQNSAPRTQQAPKSPYQPSHRPNDKPQAQQQKPSQQQDYRRTTPVPPPNQSQKSQQSRQEPSYQNNQQQQRKPDNSSGGRISSFQKAPDVANPEWLKKQIEEQRNWEKPNFYRGMDGMEDLPENLFS